MNAVGSAIAIRRARKLSQGQPVVNREGELLVPGHLKDRCLEVTRTELGIGARYASAHVAYTHVPVHERHRHLPPPPGHPCFFRTANSAWHVTLSDDEPWFVWSTDIKRPGQVDRVPKSFIQQRWNAEWLGWTESLNGVPIPTG